MTYRVSTIDLCFTKRETSHKGLKWWSWDSTASPLMSWVTLLSNDSTNVLISCNFAHCDLLSISVIVSCPFFSSFLRVESKKETYNFNFTIKNNIIGVFSVWKILGAFRKHNRSVRMYRQQAKIPNSVFFIIPYIQLAKQMDSMALKINI